MSDTVLNNSMVNFPARPDTHWLQIIRHIAKAQAEITGDIAWQKGWREGIDYSNERFKHKDAYKAGMKEVVEWSNEPCIMHGDADKRIREGTPLRQGHCYECWQAFLKERGLLPSESEEEK